MSVVYCEEVDVGMIPPSIAALPALYTQLRIAT